MLTAQEGERGANAIAERAPTARGVSSRAVARGGRGLHILDNRTLYRHNVMEFSSVVQHRTLVDVGYNGRLKTYPDGTQELLVCDKPIFGLSGWEDVETKAFSAGKRKRGTKNDSERSQRRARQQIRDYALCSEFDYFVTLTFDQRKIDRYNIDVIIKRLRVWLDNRVRRNGLRYILVPERHKDGAIHFHGFFNDVLKVVDSGHCDSKGHKIYNLPSWGFGFTTAIKLYGDYPCAVSYVCKYVGKSPEKIGGRWYYSGGSLKLPQVDFVDVSADVWDSADGSRFDLPEAKLSFVSFRHSLKK